MHCKVYKHMLVMISIKHEYHAVLSLCTSLVTVNALCKFNPLKINFARLTIIVSGSYAFIMFSLHIIFHSVPF